MAYTALQKMREKNMQNEALKKYGEKIGPKVPVLDKNSEVDLRLAALTFIHDRCEDLRFDEKITVSEENGDLKGISVKAGQIPFNMQMDIDRLCMERAVERFLESGVAEDAFCVYFCYLEMFVGRYGKSRRMIELLSEFETNSSSLLMKHRDHYSHSVYVFLLGLAIYETNAIYREAYKNEYGLENEQETAHHFMKYWGLASLFHDIGYPFELPFEQVCSYFEVGGNKRKEMPFISYNSMEKYTVISPEAEKFLNEIYDGQKFENLNQLFAYEIAKRIGVAYDKTESDICKVLETKPVNPDSYGYFMDHAYFSATILMQELFQCVDVESFSSAHIDAVIAILLHNSLYKFSITNVKDEKVNKPFKLELHPLAYMLMLCDELQCWDRTSYGRNSRTETHPMGCKFTFEENGIQATYVYDEEEAEKIQLFEEKYAEYEKMSEETKVEEPKLKAYSNMVHDNSFQKDIENIIDTSKMKVSVSVCLEQADYACKQTYLSNSNFLHLYDFAVALNAQYNALGEDDEKMIESFEQLSLEYKLSNILQAKEFEEHLDSIGCFYTDRPVAYPMINKFEDDELIELGIREHDRWEREKYNMCWSPADEVEEVMKDKNLREQTRMHYDLNVCFENLPEEEQIKDMKPLNTMMQKLKEFDGLRIYRLKR